MKYNYDILRLIVVSDQSVTCSISSSSQSLCNGNKEGGKTGLYHTLLSSGNTLKWFTFVHERLQGTTGQSQSLKRAPIWVQACFFRTRNSAACEVTEWLTEVLNSIAWCQLKLSYSVSAVKAAFLLHLQIEAFYHDGSTRVEHFTASSKQETPAGAGVSENAAEFGEGESGAALKAGQLPLDQRWYSHEEKQDKPPFLLLFSQTKWLVLVSYHYLLDWLVTRV